MWQTIKQWPTAVKLSAAFLVITWCVLMSAWPLMIIAATLIVLLFVSIVRVAIFMLDGR